MKKKIKTFNNRFLMKFSFVYFKNNLLKNIFIFLSLVISFSSFLLAIGFYEGTNKFIENSQNHLVDMNYFNISKKETYAFENSPFQLVKFKRPKENDVLFLEHYLEEYVISYDYQKIFPGAFSLLYFEKQITDCLFSPFYNIDQLKMKSDLLIHGEIKKEDSLFDIYINETFAKTLSQDLESLINSTLSLTTENKIIYDFSLPLEINFDYFNVQNNFKISGIFRELNFLNEPKLFYSYSSLEVLLKNTILENLSEFRQIQTSCYDLFSLIDDENYLHNYQLNLFIFSSNDYISLSMLIKTLEESHSQIEIFSTSELIKKTYFELTKASFYSMIIFIVIAFLGSAFLIMISAYTNFVTRKKDAALLVILGLKHESLFNIFYYEILFVSLLSVLFSFLFSCLLSKLANLYFLNKFSFEKLIIIPISKFLNINFFLPFLCIFIASFLSYLFTFFPLYRQKKKPLIDELKEE